MKSKTSKPVVPIMFENEMKKKIETAAKKEGRTFAGQVRHVLAKWLEINAFAVLFCFLFTSCSNPVKPDPLGICILEQVRFDANFPMWIDTVVTCNECDKMASLGYYHKVSWTPVIN